MASPAAERYLATLPPADQEAIRAGGDVDAWYQAAVNAGAVPATYGGANTAENQARLQQQGGNDWQTEIDASDPYASRDWSGSANARQMDEQYQRLLSMGVAPNRAKRIVSIALGGMEHDWQQYKGESNAGFMQEYDTNPTDWVNNFLWGEKNYDPTCPQNAPYRAENGEGCVEKPWDTGYDPSKHRGEEGAGGGAGGAGGGMGGAGAVGTVANAGANDLQRQLEAQYAAKGGLFSPANQPGIRLNEGGLLWTDQPASTAPLGSPAPGGGNRGNRPRNQGNEAAALPPPDQSGQAALMSATLNAFTPNAPSATGAGEAQGANSQWNLQPQGWTGQAEGGPGQQALVDATGKYLGPQAPATPATAQQRRSKLAWWQGPQTA